MSQDVRVLDHIVLHSFFLGSDEPIPLGLDNPQSINLSSSPRSWEMYSLDLLKLPARDTSKGTSICSSSCSQGNELTHMQFNLSCCC